MRIFLASPDDVVPYREAALRVAERLNQQTGAKLGSPPYLEVVDWSHHLAPHLALPESAVLEEVEVEEDDFFLGIAWLAFDPLVAGGEGENHGATERNFELALRHWQGSRADNCLVCRAMRLPEKLTEIDGKAFDRINRFFSRFTMGGENPVPYYEFHSTTDLEEHLAARLAGKLQALGGQVSAAPIEESTPEAEKAEDPAEPQAEFERKMEPGKAYEVSFLSIEVGEDEALAKVAAEFPNKVQRLYGAFRELVLATASNYGGELFSWENNRGLIIFWRSRSYDHAIMTGLKVLHNLPVFNLDTDQNPLGFNVRTRSSAHDAVIIFQMPSSNIRSTEVDFLVSMQRTSTEPEELTITRRLLERVDSRLKPHFKFKGRFESEPIYACRLPSADTRATQEDLDEYTVKLKHHAGQVREVLQAPPSALDISALEVISTGIDEVYSLLGKFCSTFSNLDNAWPADFFTRLAAVVSVLMEEEAEVWKTLRRVYVEGNFTAGKARKLEAIVQAASRRRSRPVVILDKLEQRCRAMGGGEEPSEATPAQVDEDLSKRLDAFLKADPLDNETALTELLLHHKGPLLEYLVGGGGEQHHNVLDKLWSTCDLVLLDDLYSIRGRKRADDARVLDTLVDPRLTDARFRVVAQLLEGQDDPTERLLQSRFAESGVEPAEGDLQVAWRSLVIGHASAEIRTRSAFLLTPHSMWQVISHPSIPIPSIHAIAERMQRMEGEDAQKIFFDCVRSRLEEAVESFRTKDEVTSLTQLVLLLLELPFLVETGYFERFDDILRKFLERSQKAGLKVEYFENLRRTLEEARAASPDKGPSKPPAGIKRLPLTIQRRLAGEARYVYWFVSHPDPRIALETLRHVGLMNIERVLRLREVNSSVMKSILKKPELFTRAQALAAALNHPKCSQEFATRYIPSLVRSRQGVSTLEKVTNNPSANPAVRSAAKRALSGASRAGRR